MEGTVDLLRRDVEALARSGHRVVGTSQHREARAWLVERLAGLGLEPYSGARFELPYRAAGAELVNVVARLPGSAPAAERSRPLLFVAHYDTCGPQPGADDNAASIAAALAATERLQREPLACDLVLGFFDAEEPPHFLSPAMGSIRFFEDQRRDDFRCAIVMDLIGHDLALPGLEDVLVMTGAESLAAVGSDGELRGLFGELPPAEGLRVLPIRNEYVGDMSDHHVFRLHGAPYLFLTCGEWPDYHQPTDTPERLNYARIERTADYLVALARWLEPLETGFADRLSEREEVARFREVAGAALAGLFPGPIETSAQLSRIVAGLRAALGAGASAR